MSSSSKQTVFLLGATGNTGSSIARALAKEPEKFAVKALIRHSSLEKPIVQELKSLGIEIIEGDVDTDTQETLESHFKNIDTVINTTVPFYNPDFQNKIIRAAKNAKVNRFVPSDFGPWTPPGSMKYQDEKVAIQELIKKQGLPYTFIYVGSWTSAFFPAPHDTEGSQTPVFPFQREFFGSGKVKSAYITVPRIGDFVARIISDPRTLNQSVQAYDGEATLEESWKLAENLTGEKFDDYTRISADEVESRIKESDINRVLFEYLRAFWIRGDNTVENAVKSGGALDARKLYPEYVPASLEECAKGFYSQFVGGQK